MKTFIAKPTPAPDDIRLTMCREQARKVLTAVWDEVDKATLNNIPSVEELLNKVGITQDTYEKAHGALTKRNTVIYKRTFEDCWVC